MKRSGGIIASLLLGGCATSSVTLLADDGSPNSGALAVIEDDGSETVLNQPMTSGKLTKGETKVRPVKELKPAYQQLVGGLPPAPAHFTLNFVQGTTEVTAASRPVLDLIRQEVANRPGAAIEERFALNDDGSRLDYTMTVADSATFTAPVTLRKTWEWRPGEQVKPYQCRQ